MVKWNTWRRGLNLLLRENEIDGAEMVTATNLILTGSGVPTKRWGSQDYFLAGATGSTRFLMFAKNSNSTREVLALTDWGILTKKSGTSYTAITGASWPSGSTVEGAQLGDKVYLASSSREMTRYDFSTLTSFATIATPTGVLVTNMSGATGGSTWSWRVSAVGRSGGETLASTPISRMSLPQDLTKTVMRVFWTTVSAASGDLVGYNIYRGTPGDEKYIGGVEVGTTQFDDAGLPTNDPFRTPPEADGSGGPKGKYIIRFQDRLIISGLVGDPTKVMISGRYPDHERFDWFAGGGSVLIEPDSGQDITGLGIHQEKLVIFKENSVWQVTLNVVQYGLFLILDPQYKLLTASQGCSSHRSIVPVENDLMFANRRGIYILRYEPQLLTILNANEISAKIRPYFNGLTEADHTSSSGAYLDKKYILSFPNAKETICFDRERLSFTGPWPTPYGIRQWAKFSDNQGIERWAAADANDPCVSEFSSNYPDDKNISINTLFRSKKEDFGDWTIFKTINEIFMNLRATRGTILVNIYIEERSGRVIVAKAFTITASEALGTSGIGTDLLGDTQLGFSENSASSSDDELPKKAFIFKASRTFQVEIRTTGRTDNYELLGITAVAIPQSRGNNPSSWNVS